MLVLMALVSVLARVCLSQETQFIIAIKGKHVDVNWLSAPDQRIRIDIAMYILLGIVWLAPGIATMFTNRIGWCAFALFIAYFALEQFCEHVAFYLQDPEWLYRILMTVGHGLACGVYGVNWMLDEFQRRITGIELVEYRNFIGAAAYAGTGWLFSKTYVSVNCCTPEPSVVS